MLPTSFVGLRVDVSFGESGSLRFAVSNVTEDGTARLRPCRKNGIGVDIRKRDTIVNVRWPRLHIEDSGHRFA